MTRTAVAGTLWPEVSDSHAHSSLRSALSRLDKTARDAVLVTSADLCIGDSVTVDLRDARKLSHRLLDANADLEDGDLSADSVRILSTDLLPDWYDDWVLLEAENWRQLRLHALESLAGHLLDNGQLGDAAAAAGSAVDAEPLRESARTVLIRVHLAEGNQAEAIDEFERYQALLADELGVAPSAELRALVDGGAIP